MLQNFYHKDTSQSEISKLINLRFDNQKLRSLNNLVSVDENYVSTCETRGFGA